MSEIKKLVQSLDSIRDLKKQTLESLSKEACNLITDLIKKRGITDPVDIETCVSHEEIVIEVSISNWKIFDIKILSKGISLGNLIYDKTKNFRLYDLLYREVLYTLENEMK